MSVQKCGNHVVIYDTTFHHTTFQSLQAYVATMLSRLEHNHGSHWSLTVKINDGSAAVDVDISDQVRAKCQWFYCILTGLETHDMTFQA